MKILNYTILLQPEAEGGYTVSVPALQGCITYGETIDKARLMAKDAILGYIKSLKKHGEVIPQENSSLISNTAPYYPY